MSSRAKPKNASPGRKARGKPFVVGNTSGRGRPKGSLNKTTLLCQELLAEGAEAVTKKVVQLAKKGDPAAMQIVMQRVCPARPGVAVQMNMKPITCADDLPVAYASALDVVNTGRLTLVEGQQYLSILDRVAKTLQFVFGPPWKPDHREIVKTLIEARKAQAAASEEDADDEDPEVDDDAEDSEVEEGESDE